MKRFCSLFVLPLLFLAPGCRSKTEKTAALPVLSAPPAQGLPSPHGPAGEGMGMKRENKVVVPPALQGKWKAIRISVMDKGKKDTIQVIGLGGERPIPTTDLTLRIDTLLSDFGMGNGVITSRSEQMNNPAAQVEIFEGGKSVWKGWLFTRFPDAHPFVHDKYGIKLLDFVPAK